MRRTERSKKNKSYITVSRVHDAVWLVGICLKSTYFHSNGQKPNYTCMWNESLWLVGTCIAVLKSITEWILWPERKLALYSGLLHKPLIYGKENIYMYNHKNIVNKKNYSHLRFLHHVAISININIYSPYHNIMLIYIFGLWTVRACWLFCKTII